LNGVVVSPAATTVLRPHPADGTAGTFAGSSTVVVVLAASAALLELLCWVAAFVPLLEQALTVKTSAQRATAERCIVRP
jgi:hypothetical protein